MDKTIIATPMMLSRAFQFTIHRVDKTLGSLGSVPYYYMDSARFRECQPAANFRACVDFYAAVVEQNGGHDLSSKFSMVFAELYPYVSEARTQQTEYLDAYLRRMQIRESTRTIQKGRLVVELDWRIELRTDEDKRIREIARSRNTPRVQKALDETLLKALLGGVDFRPFAQLEQDWLYGGVDAFDAGGSTGLQAYAKALSNTFSKIRKRGGAKAQFLNRFQYICKTRFYLCYANAWIGIINWLQEHEGLSRFSQRLLRVWHAQGQPPGGEDDITGMLRDPFMGQVLALHPLTTFALAKPEHLGIISRWIGHPRFEDLVDQGLERTATEYWEMVGTLLVAATEYRLSRDQWNETIPVFRKKAEQRKSRRKSSAPKPATQDEASPAFHFNELASARGLVCLQCGHPVEYQRHVLPKQDGGNVEIIYTCKACSAERPLKVSEDDMRTFLTRDDEDSN